MFGRVWWVAGSGSPPGSPDGNGRLLLAGPRISGGGLGPVPVETATELQQRRRHAGTRDRANAYKSLIELAPWVGIEPTTNGLTVRRSTAELPGNTVRILEGREFSRTGPGVSRRGCRTAPQNVESSAGSHLSGAATRALGLEGPPLRPSARPAVRPRGRGPSAPSPSPASACCRRTKCGRVRVHRSRSRGPRRRRPR